MLSKKFGLAVILFVLALVTRTFWLDKFPTGITNDELHFVLNAKAVWYGFTDMSGVWNPLSLTTIPDNPSAELTSPFLAPFLGPITLDLFSTKLIFAVISSLLVVVIYLIGCEINLKIGVFGGLVTIINPWFFYMGRVAFDQPLALFFLTLSFYTLLKLKSKWILFSLVPLVLGFYTYIGFKVIFLPFVFSTVFFVWLRNKKKFGREYVAILVVSLVITIGFAKSVLMGPSRLGELITPLDRQIAEMVETERMASMGSVLNKVYVNKFTVYGKFFIDKYLNSFSPSVLFVKGDETYLLSWWKHGYFYYLDILFLIVGFYYLFKKHKGLFWILIFQIVLSPIPEALRKDFIPAYSFHSSWQYPFLVLIIGMGIYSVCQRYSKLSIPIIFIYLILFVDLLNLYFFRYPIYQPEGFGLSNRVLVKYISFEQELGNKLTIVTPEPSNLFRQYLFYTKKYNKENFEKVVKLYKNNREDISFDGIRFARKMPEDDLADKTIFITQANYLLLHGSHRDISQIGNGKEMFYIYNSKLCPPKKRQDVLDIKLNDFDIEKMQLDEFCGKFISVN